MSEDGEDVPDGITVVEDGELTDEAYEAIHESPESSEPSDGSDGATIFGMDAKTEEASARDGLLSYAGEWHALTIGVYRGLSTYKPWSDDYDEIAEQFADVAAEPWYYKGGYIIGTMLQIGMIFLVLFAWAWWSP